jgi:hypothetical protein
VIWYRHWLELRRTVLMLVTAAIVLGPLNASNRLFDGQPPLSPNSMFRPLQTLAPTFDMTQITAIAGYQQFLWLAILLATYVLSGDAFRTFERSSGSVVTTTAQYTLALPISRRRIAMTRIAAGWLIAAAGLAALLTATVVTFEVFDRTAPLVPMLLASGFASLVILFWMCVLTTMGVVAGWGWGSALTFIPMLVSTPFAMQGMSASASRTLEWPVLLLLGIALAGATWVMTEVAAGDEV